MTGFNVDTEELSRQAEAITEVAEGIREARSASDEEGVGGLVYGIIFDPTILPILTQAKDTFATAITNSADIGDAIAKGLKSNVDTYKAVEDELVKQFGKIQAGGGS